MIPAEAVEAAMGEWACWPRRPELVTKMLEAAAPVMLASAWDEGWQACIDYTTFPEIDGEAPTSDNPYRSAK